jgi:hypothetical protein
MTDTLRDALRDAAAGPHPTTYTTGRELLRRGRRKARLRRVSTTAAGGLALVALVGVPLATGVLIGADDGPTATRPSDPGTIETNVEPANFEVRSVSELEDACRDIADYEDWPVVAALKSEHSTTAVLVSPDGEQWATCFGSNDGMSSVLYGMKVRDDPDYRDLRVGAWWDGCETGADPELCWWGAYGQIPPNVARMTFESADGQTSEAVVRNGYYAWQSDVDAIDAFNEPLWVSLYDADGNRIDRLDFNRDLVPW